MPAGAAAPISTPSSAAASTTAITCCSSGNERRWPISTRSARSTPSSGPGEAGDPVCRSRQRRALDACGPNRGRVPWWVLSPARRVPGTRARDYLAALRLRRAGARRHRRRPRSTRRRLLYRRLVAAVRGRGAEHQRRSGVGAAVLARPRRDAGPRRRRLPAAGAARGAVGKPRRPGAGDAARARRARSASARGCARSISPGTASPASISTAATSRSARRTGGAGRAGAGRGRLVPGLTCPTITRRSSMRITGLTAPAGHAAFAGLIGGTAEWVFLKREVVSVTVSAADRLVDRPAEELAALFWRDVAAAFGLPPDAGAAGAHRQGAARDVSRHAGAVAAPAGARDALAQSSCWPAIMSIPACPPRSKALFAPALPRPRRSSGAVAATVERTAA